MCLKKKTAVAVLLAVCLFLAGCSVSQPAPATQAPPTPGTAAQSGPAEGGEALQFRITWKTYSGRGEAIGVLVEQYNQTSPNHVTMIDGDEDMAAIEAMLLGDTQTVYVLPYRYIQYFGSKGYLADLTDAFAEDWDLFYKEIWALATVQDRIYGIPWLGHSMCLLYNKNLLQRAGVDPDSITDRDAFLNAIRTIAEKTGAKGLGLIGAESNDISWMVNQFIYGFGSALVAPGGKTVAINNRKSVEALQMYRDVLGLYAQDGWQNDTAEDVLASFRSQEIAFEILGIWGVTDIAKNGSPFEVGILPLQTIGLCAEVGPMMLAVPCGMSDAGRQAAVSFIRFMISKGAQEEIMKGEYSPEHDAYYPFRTPIRVDMADSQIFISHLEYQLFIDGFQNPSVDVPVPAWQTVKDEVYEPGLHRVMTGETTLQDFLSEMEEKGNQILQSQ